jgi:hypothetical protein
MGATALTPQLLKENWEKLKGLVAGNLPSREAAVFLHLLDTLKEDQPNGQKHYLGFFRAPAARRNHHAYEGGLVQHLLEMWSLWDQLKPQLNAPPFISDERVLKAIILHDLHKASRTYELMSSDPWEVRHGDDETDMLMGTDVKSLWLAQRAGITLDPEQINALLWAEGGFSNIRPRWCSVLAKVCYALDELSGNGLARNRKRTFLDHSRISD